jgi:hypothetical protein
LFSIKVIINEKPEKNVAADAVRKNALSVAFWALTPCLEQR